MADAKSELYELKRLEAVPTKNSGRGKFEKGDGIIYSPFGDPLITVDVKESNKSFGLSESVWVKTTTDAKKNNTEPSLAVVLGEAEPKTRLVVISEVLFKEMKEAWLEKYYGD